MKFIDYIEEVGYEAVHYSGRGMYGEKCVAVYTNEPLRVLVLIAASAGADEDSETIDVIADARIDSMGLESVLYWPDAKIEE